MCVAKKQHARSLFRTERAVCLIINVTFYKICRWIWLFINEMLKKANIAAINRRRSIKWGKDPLPEGGGKTLMAAVIIISTHANVIQKNNAKQAIHML